MLHGIGGDEMKTWTDDHVRLATAAVTVRGVLRSLAAELDGDLGGELGGLAMLLGHALKARRHQPRETGNAEPGLPADVSAGPQYGTTAAAAGERGTGETETATDVLEAAR
jgi:hypothetical protein